MVFPSPVSKSQAPQQLSPVNMNDSSRRLTVAAASSSSPANSHPLHNFPLSDLKWAMNHTNTHRLRKPSEKLPLREADLGIEVEKGNLAVEKSRKGVSTSSSDLNLEKKTGNATGGFDCSAGPSEKKSTAMGSRSKILIRIRPKSINNAAESNCTEAASVAADGSDVDSAAAAAAVDADGSLHNQIWGGGQEAEEFASRTRNLRSTKPPTRKRSNGNAGGSQKNLIGSTLNKVQGTGRPESTRSRSSADAKIAAETKGKKQKFSISLTKMEIDEDFFALIGSKPSRRPKKRVRNLQKQLDVLFPGLWIGHISPNAYKVSDHAQRVSRE